MTQGILVCWQSTGGLHLRLAQQEIGSGILGLWQSIRHTGVVAEHRWRLAQQGFCLLACIKARLRFLVNEKASVMPPSLVASTQAAVALELLQPWRGHAAWLVGDHLQVKVVLS